MKTLILYFAILLNILLSQQLPNESRKWLDESLKDESIVEMKELKSEFISNDFSSVWLKKQENIIGFIGDNFQRFYIHFQEIVKNDTNPSAYFVKGSSRVSNNICTFEGEFSVLHIREIRKQEKKEMLRIGKESNDSDLIKRASQRQFMILTEYTFKEDNNQKGSGTFKGIMKSYFYIKNNSVTYDDLDLEYSDSYSNNLCVGIWNSFRTGAEKKCNWGDYRIPYSGDLDGGTAEFSPIEKYLKHGWQSYHDAYFKSNQEAQKEEKKKWW